jgi:hypothetical protein
MFSQADLVVGIASFKLGVLLQVFHNAVDNA